MSQALIERCAGCAPTWPQVFLEVSKGVGTFISSMVLLGLVWLFFFQPDED